MKISRECGDAYEIEDNLDENDENVKQVEYLRPIWIFKSADNEVTLQLEIESIVTSFVNIAYRTWYVIRDVLGQK